MWISTAWRFPAIIIRKYPGTRGRHARSRGAGGAGPRAGQARWAGATGVSRRARWASALVCLVLAGLGLVLAACQGVGASRPAAYHAVLRPLPEVTITTGNITFTSAVAPGSASQSRQATVTTARVRTGAAVTRSAAATLVDRRPDLGISVSVSSGTLSTVTVTSGAGNPVPGTLGAGGISWHTTWALAPSQVYHVTAAATDGPGRETVASGSFRTLTPRQTFAAATSLGWNQVYGVGMPIMITFSHPVTDKAGVERALSVRASKPVTGAWYWMSSSEVWFRTRTYWPAHTRVWFEAHLKGVRAAPGVYGDANLSGHFRIGNSLIAVASAASHHMKVWYNGHFRGNWPISTGQPGLDTPNGHYLSFDMGNPVDMNSASFGVMPGDPGYYNVLVYDSVKFTADGDYVHSAPWSVGEQGYANVSHGCVNVAPANAAWYYSHSVLGDPITVVGSPAHGIWNDGWTIWFLSWHKLLAGSATGQQVQVTGSGSQFQTPAAAGPGWHRWVLAG
jgi:lipoprotein-anchoring transpeptidase ErfK/SrfK